MRCEVRIDDERDRAGEEIVLPDIGGDGRECAAGMDLQGVFDAPGDLNARSEAVEVCLVAGLRVVEILLHLAGGWIDFKKAGGALGAFEKGRIDLPAQAVVDDKAIG